MQTRAARKDRAETMRQREALLSTAGELRGAWEAFAERNGLPVPSSAVIVRRGWTTDVTGPEKQVLVGDVSDLLRRTKAVQADARRVCGPAAPDSIPTWFSRIVDMLSPFTVVASSF